VSHFKVFGCTAFAHIPNSNKRKLDAKSIKCIFIGYCTDQTPSKLFDPSSHKLFASRDVLFHEQTDKSNTKNDTWHISNDAHLKLDTLIKQEQEQVQVQVQDHDDSSSMSTSSSSESSQGGDTPQNQRIMDGPPTPRRSSRQTRLPERYRDYALMSNIMNVEEPIDYEQAKLHEPWINAMNDQYASIM